jgi:dynein heavy chain
MNLQKKIENIESAIIIKPISNSMALKELNEFSDYFDQYRIKQIADLQRDYEEISNFLKQIEQTAFETDTQCHGAMTTYYQYWERKIFNALISMTIRALATNKVIWDRENPMVKQECKYISNEFQYNPTLEEMTTQL